ncbi:MAG: hypothetical protein R3E90_00620 [Marinicella sp.]
MSYAEILTTNAIAIAIVGYLLKLWVDKRLTQSLQKEFEKFKVPLAKEISLYSIQNQWNHAKKMELLSKLFEKILDVEGELVAFLMNAKTAKMDLVMKRANKLCENYLELNSLLHKNELFLEQSLVDHIREAYKPYFEMARVTIDESYDFQGFADSLPDDIDDLFSVANSPKMYILEKFRKSAGIDV